MENFLGFTWGYLYLFFRIGGLIPYVPNAKENAYLAYKWHMFSIFHILFNISFCILNSLVFNTDHLKNVVVCVFNYIFTMTDFISYPLSVVYALLSILIRREKIYSLLRRYSLITKNVQLKKINKGRNFILFCYFIIQFCFNILAALTMIENPNNSLVAIFFFLYGGSELLLIDLNFCIFVSNLKFLFKSMNLQLLNIMTIKRKKVFMKDIKEFRRIREECCELVELIQTCFMDSITINTACEFTGFVLVFYDSFRCFSLASIMSTAYWAMFYMCKISAKIYVCSSTTKEVNFFFRCVECKKSMRCKRKMVIARFSCTNLN